MKEKKRKKIQTTMTKFYERTEKKSPPYTAIIDEGVHPNTNFLTISSLSKDIAIHITSFLCPNDIVQLSRTSHWMYNAVTSGTYYKLIPKWDKNKNQFILPNDKLVDRHLDEWNIFFQWQDVQTLKWILRHPPISHLNKYWKKRVISDSVCAGGISLLLKILDTTEQKLLDGDIDGKIGDRILIGATERGDSALVGYVLDKFAQEPTYLTLTDCLSSAAKIGNVQLINTFSDLLDDIYEEDEEEAKRRGCDNDEEDKIRILMMAMRSATQNLKINAMECIYNLIEEKDDFCYTIKYSRFDLFGNHSYLSKKPPSMEHSMTLAEFLQNKGLSNRDLIFYLLQHSHYHIMTRILVDTKETIDWQDMLTDMVDNILYDVMHYHCDALWFCVEKGAKWTDDLIEPSFLFDEVNNCYHKEYRNMLCKAVGKSYTTWEEIRATDGDWEEDAITYVEEKMKEHQ